MKKISYWAPCLDKVGTYNAVINSALSLSKYSKDFINVSIINVCGEWDSKKDFFSKNNIEVIDINFSYFNYLPKAGYLGSRISYLIITLFSVIPLINFLNKHKPEFIIGHLITSLPIFLFNFFNFQTKFILRISGYPRLNFFRKSLWKFFSKKIFKVTSPSEDLKNQLIENKIFTSEKIFFLPDPIINLGNFKTQIQNFQNKDTIIHNKYFIAVGRLTKQKNFSYLIDEFYQYSLHQSDHNLLIFGEGEEREKLEKKIIELKLNSKVFLMGFSNNIFAYMKNARAFILSSLWEDPGFVIIEAAFCNLFVISSNCKNGPNEFLMNGKAGLIYEKDKKDSLKNSFKLFENLSSEKLKSMKLKAKINCSKYTLLRHHNSLKKILFLV